MPFVPSWKDGVVIGLDLLSAESSVQTALDDLQNTVATDQSQSCLSECLSKSNVCLLLSLDSMLSYERHGTSTRVFGRQSV